MAFPRSILDRIESVHAYHQSSKLHYGNVPAAGHGAPPTPYLDFPDQPRAKLPTTLLDEPLGVLDVLDSSIGALPDSYLSPPQDLKTLATWLHMAAGVVGRRRTFPSHGELYPSEIYVAAFALHDLEPGFYHFNPRSFTLTKLRDGAETLSQIKRGRPDLEFIKRAPAALLVSTIYCRSSWRFGLRGYRAALLDAGRAVQNLVTAAAGLGIQTITRLRMTESTMRELIGVSAGASFMQEESVQSMVVWADRTQREAILTHLAASNSSSSEHAPFSDASLDDALPSSSDTTTATAPRVAINAGGAAIASLDVPDLLLPSFGRRGMPPLARAPLTSDEVIPQPAILGVHHDCVAPGVAIRDIRPPLTELSPLHSEYPPIQMARAAQPDHGTPLRSVLLNANAPRDFSRGPIPRDAFRTICRLAFAGGSYFPMFPAGAQAAFPRTFWVIHNVAGMDPGVWYHRASSDEWCLLREGSFRLETHYLAGEDDAFASAAAVGFVVVSLGALLTRGGPDTYRLAHLETGTVSRRLSLAAAGLGFASIDTLNFFEDEIRAFLGIEKIGWEPIAAIALGQPATSAGPSPI
jgi:SagB-type dehydrogenase family enzyme